MVSGRWLRVPTSAVLVTAVVLGVPVAVGAASDQELVRTILTSSDRGDRDDAARALADQLDPTPIKKLGAKADESTRAASALELIERRVARRASKARGVSTRIKAVKVLGVIDFEASADDLATIVVETSTRKVRTAAATALGRLEEAGPLAVDTLLAASVTSFDDPAQEAAIERALRAIGPAAAEPLLGAFDAGDYDTQSRVIQFLHAIERKHPNTLDEVGPTVVETLIGRIGQGEDVAGLLAQVGAPAVPRLIEIARQPPTPAGPLDDPPSVAQLALTMMAERDRALLAPLDAALQNRDLALVADLMTFYISLGTPGSEEVMVAALNSLGNTDRAQIIVLEFLNSGHQPLVDAGYDWAARHGYTITGTPGGPSPGGWGTIDAVPGS